MAKTKVNMDVEKVKVQAQKAMVTAKAHLKKAEKEVAAKIRKNPEQAVLIAAAVGAAVGAIATFAVTRKKK